MTVEEPSTIRALRCAMDAGVVSITEGLVLRNVARASVDSRVRRHPDAYVGSMIVVSLIEKGLLREDDGSLVVTKRGWIVLGATPRNVALWLLGHSASWPGYL